MAKRLLSVVEVKKKLSEYIAYLISKGHVNVLSYGFSFFLISLKVARQEELENAKSNTILANLAFNASPKELEKIFKTKEEKISGDKAREKMMKFQGN